MYRIDNSTVATTLPTPGAVGPNPNGYFTDGNPASGIPPTVVDDDWLNAVQEEIIGAVVASGQTPSKTNRGQLAAAIGAVGTNAIAATNPGRLLGCQTFFSSGIYTPTAGTNFVIAEVLSGGAAGGGSPACSSTQVSAAGGGGSGAYTKGKLTSGFSGVTVTVGAGGTPVSGQNTGGAGGTSSFGSLLVCTGGSGGAGGAPNVGAVGGGAGGAVTTAGNIVNMHGQAGAIAQANWSSTIAIYYSGDGGSSVFGVGGRGLASTSGGLAGTDRGSGGSGAVTAESGGASAGGAGQPGVVIVWEYS